MAKTKRSKNFILGASHRFKLTRFCESQNLNQNNPRVSANLETRPLRGAKNQNQASSSASADFLLEADKRGSPPKSEKRQLLARRGSGVGGAALLRKELSEIDENSVRVVESASLGKLESWGKGDSTFGKSQK